MNSDADQHDDEASASEQQTPIASADDAAPAVRIKKPPFAAMALLVLASPFLIDAPIIVALKGTSESPISPVLMGLLIAKFGLLVMWLGWGGSRVVLRLPILTLSCFFSAWLTPGTPTDTFEEFSFLLFMLLGCGAIVALPRLWRIRWTSLEELENGNLMKAERRYQFSIFDMLVWTTTTAVFLGLFRIVGFPRDLYIEIIFIILIGGASLITGIFAAMWTELTLRPVTAARVGIALCIAAVLAIVPVYLTGPNEREVIEVFVMYVTTAVCLLGACYVIRGYGYRLVWQRRAKQPLRTA
jgi:hypothetical protein